MHTKPVIMMAFLLVGATALAGFAAEPAAGTPDSVQPSDASVRVVASSNSDDLQVTAQIRQALAADPSLSDLAHSVQVATNSDAVILRGVVESTEKDRVNALAQQFAGARQIMDELTVRAHE
jgi:osmotically-inducible protein OsmY